MADNGDTETGLPASVQRLAAMIRKARDRRGWSQTVLAETAHVDHNVISRIELGQYDPPFGLVSDLVKILGLPIEDAIYNRRVSKQRVREDGEEVPQHDP
jgi:ribosome-binding protein aMBF1 (putative translation factor)